MLSKKQSDDVNKPVIKYDIKADRSGLPLLNERGQVVATHPTSYGSINGEERLSSENLYV